MRSQNRNKRLLVPVFGATGLVATGLFAWFFWPGSVFWVDRYWEWAITSEHIDPSEDRFSWTVAVDWSPDNSMVASGGYYHDVLLWDAASGELLFQLHGHRSWIQEVIWFADGRHLASADWNGELIVWDLDTRRPAARLATGEEDDVFGIGVHPGGNQIAAGTSAGRTFVFDWRSGETLHELASNPGGTLYTTYTPDGSLLATGGEDGAVRFFETTSYREVGSVQAHSAGVTAISFTENGHRMLSCGDDGIARQWDLDDLAQTASWKVDRGWVNFCTFVPGSVDFLTASSDGAIRLWAANDEAPSVLYRHSDWAQCVRTSRDGRLLVSGGKEGAVKIFDLGKGEQTLAIDVSVAL